jgi:hypothetical protein
VRRLGGADLGAGGRGLESRHPDQFRALLILAGVPRRLQPPLVTVVSMVLIGSC